MLKRQNNWDAIEFFLPHSTKQTCQGTVCRDGDFRGIFQPLNIMSLRRNISMSRRRTKKVKTQKVVVSCFERSFTFSASWLWRKRQHSHIWQKQKKSYMASITIKLPVNLWLAQEKNEKWNEKSQKWGSNIPTQAESLCKTASECQVNKTRPFNLAYSFH